MQTRFKKRLGFWAITVLLFIVLLVFVTGAPFRVYRGISPTKMRALVISEIPLGADIASVEKFLDSHGIEHAPYSESNRDIGAIKRNVCVALLVECSIDLRFFFDDSRRLNRISVQEGFTGL
jgi:hypothetical protein